MTTLEEAQQLSENAKTRFAFTKDFHKATLSHFENAIAELEKCVPTNALEKGAVPRERVTGSTHRLTGLLRFLHSNNGENGLVADTCSGLVQHSKRCV